MLLFFSCHELKHDGQWSGTLISMYVCVYKYVYVQVCIHKYVYVIMYAFMNVCVWVCVCL